jgi:hypothetical protein
VAVIERGPADEAVVIVKPDAEEAMVTSRRGKRPVSGRKPEVKGGTRKRNRKLIKDERFEIGLRGATEYPRRRERVNRSCTDRRKASAKTRVK